MLKTNALLLHAILDGYPVSLGGYCYELCSLYVGGEDHGASSSALMEKAHGMFSFSNVLSVLALVLMCCSRTQINLGIYIPTVDIKITHLC